MKTNHRIARQLALALGILAVVATAREARAAEKEVDLAAHRVEVRIEGNTVPVWIFTQVEIRGPNIVFPPNPGLPRDEKDFITVDPGDSIRINLYNFLPEPTSVVIPGQALPAVVDAGTPVPQAPVRANGRIRSLVPETPAFNVAEDEPGLRSYIWTDLGEGTYLFRSGTHVNVQVPMGLYGVIQKDFAAAKGQVLPQAYSGHSYKKSIGILISEIDPVLNGAVDTGVYGTEAYPSTIRYRPRYHLVRGRTMSEEPPETFPPPIEVEWISDADNDTPVLLRFLNAGLETHVPMLLGSHLKLVAEDGIPYPYPKELTAVTLPAGKTIDAIFTPPAADLLEISSIGKTYPLYDRRLFLSNGPLELANGDTVNDAKGMLMAIFVGPPPQEPTE